MRIALAFVLVAACSGKSKQDPQSGSQGGDSGPVLAKKLVLSWGVQQHAETADVFLQITDETGRQVSHPLGVFGGQCAVFTPGEDMHAVSGVSCKDGPTGTELHAVVRDANIIVLRLRVDEGVTPDPMAREEVTRVKAPPGAAIETG